MMKKNGFTLAEVLITLAIIGVVATLTLPSLLTNTAEQQSMTAFKKIMNTLNEAGQMNAALEGFDYYVADKGTVDDSVANGDQTLSALINERLQVTKQASVGYGASGKCTGNPTFVLRDGTAICVGGATAPTAKKPFWTIYVDTNGPKGPNQVSSCKEEGCTTKAQKLIKDQYVVTLYQGIAVPGAWTGVQAEENKAASYASRYAMGIAKRKSASGS